MTITNTSSGMTTATVLLSGGLDSYACAHFFQQRSFSVRGVFIDFGQSAARAERDAVSRLTSILAIPVTEITVRTDRTFETGELVGRNAFLLSAAILLAGVHHGILAIGVHAGTPYHDCLPGFIEQMDRLAKEQTDGCLSISAPFVRWTKAQIHQYLTAQGLPLEPAYSCESGTIPPCGSCASCRDWEALGC